VLHSRLQGRADPRVGRELRRELGSVGRLGPAQGQHRWLAIAVSVSVSGISVPVAISVTGFITVPVSIAISRIAIAVSVSIPISARLGSGTGPRRIGDETRVIATTEPEQAQTERQRQFTRASHARMITKPRSGWGSISVYSSESDPKPVAA
jgi:hypothetical protein